VSGEVARQTEWQLRVTNGCADHMSGTSEVPQLSDPLCASRKSAEMGHNRTFGQMHNRAQSVIRKGTPVIRNTRTSATPEVRWRKVPWLFENQLKELPAQIHYIPAPLKLHHAQ
jgi:hypothetical protein